MCVAKIPPADGERAFGRRLGPAVQFPGDRGAYGWQVPPAVDVAARPTPDSAAQGQPALIVRGLRKSYQGREVVRGLDLHAPRGALTAVLGPNGAGKTTTIECCEGLRRPDAGEIEVLGIDRLAGGSLGQRTGGHDSAAARTLRRRVGVMLQDGGLPKAPSARSVLRHVATLHENPMPPDDLLDHLGLTDAARTSVRRLSGGQFQRLALACAIVGRPDLVFLDEPTAGLDPRARRTVWALIRELRDHGTSLVLTTHLMDEAEELADLVAVVHEGRVVATGSPTELRGPGEVLVTLVEAPGEPDTAARALAAVRSAGIVGATVRAPTGESGSVLVVRPDDVETGREADGLPAEFAALLGAALTAAGQGAARITWRVRRLEDVFLEITGTHLDPVQER